MTLATNFKLTSAFQSEFQTTRWIIRLLFIGRTGGWWCQYYSPTIDREVCRVTFEMWRPLLTLDVGNTLLLAGLNQASSQANFVMQMKLFSPRYVRHHQPEMRQFQFRRCQLSGPKSFSARVHLDAKSSTAR